MVVVYWAVWDGWPLCAKVVHRRVHLWSFPRNGLPEIREHYY